MRKITMVLGADQCYTLTRGAEERRIYAGRANTVLANAGWPTGAEERRILWNAAVEVAQ